MAKKESSTKNFVLRVDAEMMDALEKWAADEFRSTNGQLQWIITEALKKSGRLKKNKKTKAPMPELDNPADTPTDAPTDDSPPSSTPNT